MSHGQGQGLVDALRGLAAGADVRPDGELLARFAASRDGDAFTALVRRHGPLVWGVCRRVLRREHDAEDAFQATFLVLARSARSVRRRAAVRCWLYGVALRVALRAREQAARRGAALPPDPLDSAEGPAEAAGRADLAAVLDEEVGRLPDRYREPLVLCYLLGRTNDEAARELGCPRGTVAVRLARARERLRRRLLGRGIGPAGAMPAVSAGAPPRGVISSTPTAVTAFLNGGPAAGTAFSLANGVLTGMFLNKCKAMCLVIAAAAAVAVAGAGSRALLAQAPTVVAWAPAPAPEKKKEPDLADERSAKMRKLLADRQTAALVVFREQYNQFEAGRGTLEALLADSQYLLRADLDLCPTKERRIAAREAHVLRLKKVLDINQARFDAGRASLADLELSRFHHLDAEIELEREKAR